MIPFDPEKPFVTSGIRAGNPPMKEDTMIAVADFIKRGVASHGNETALKQIHEEVRQFIKYYPMPQTI